MLTRWFDDGWSDDLPKVAVELRSMAPGSRIDPAGLAERIEAALPRDADGKAIGVGSTVRRRYATREEPVRVVGYAVIPVLEANGAHVLGDPKDVKVVDADTWGKR